jgi:hypothetical protein
VHKTSPLKKGCCWLNKNVKIQEASKSFQKLQFENVYALGGIFMNFYIADDDPDTIDLLSDLIETTLTIQSLGSPIILSRPMMTF